MPSDAVVCLPFDDWDEHLTAPDGVEVVVWRSGSTAPAPPPEVTFYVPEYMGPARTVEVVTELPRLSVVQTLTAGVDNVLPQLRPGVVLCNARGVHDASTAELAVGLVLASQRGLDDFVRAQVTGSWAHRRYPSLADRRVVVLGAGAVGQAIADRLAAFEVDLVLVGRRRRAGVHGLDEVPELLAAADIVVLAVPLDDATHHLVDAAFLARLPAGALVVNVARGPVVDTDALLAEVGTGRLRAALDVTDPEPLPADHPLWRAPGVLISPHVGGDSTAFLPRAYRLLQRQLTRYATGQPLDNVVGGG